MSFERAFIFMTFLIASLLVATLIAGCALSPQPNASLQNARETYRIAAADPQVHTRAAVELASAERMLAEAERLWRDGVSPAIVTHHAYLAERRAKIAMETAAYRAAESRVATASEARNRILLEARERELENARAAAREAESAREDAEARADAYAERASAADVAAELKRLQAEVTDIKWRLTERGWVLTLRNDLLFDSGKATLKTGAQRAIDKLAEFLNRTPDRDIAIEGFTDSTGSDETNRRLSERRADAVRQALIDRSVEAHRIDARGYGPSFPVASNDTPTGRQLNRRVEIVINPS
jgi:outer membrane protein OmpA-like peptidoglycan-associated protein